MTPFTQGTSTRSGSVDTDPQASARVLLAQQVALHGSNVPWAAAGALLLALLFVTLQWSVIAHGVLLGWLGALLRSPAVNSCPATSGRSSLSGKCHQPSP